MTGQALKSCKGKCLRNSWLQTWNPTHLRAKARMTNGGWKFHPWRGFSKFQTETWPQNVNSHAYHPNSQQLLPETRLHGSFQYLLHPILPKRQLFSRGTSILHLPQQPPHLSRKSVTHPASKLASGLATLWQGCSDLCKRKRPSKIQKLPQRDPQRRWWVMKMNFVGRRQSTTPWVNWETLPP